MNEHVAAAPPESVAVQVTLVVPAENVEPDAGEQATLTPRQLSVAGGVEKVTIAEHCPAGAETAMSPGAVTVGGELEAVTVTVATLLLESGSAVIELTDAVLVITAPSVTVHSSEATRVTVAEVPGASEVKVTVRLLPEPPHKPPPVALHDTKVRFAGKLSVISTD